MRIRKVRELGLAIWLENQPPWTSELNMDAGRPIFVVQSPPGYHPPAVMTYSSWPGERVAAEHSATFSQTAVRQAARNFGLDVAAARAVSPSPARHGALEGFEADFQGAAERVSVDVRVFVGQGSGRFPVALSIHTLEGKMGNLSQVIRRTWGNVSYLAA